MSDVGDIFTISNTFDINDLQRQQRVQMKLAEFRERADTLTRQGHIPLGFFAFEKAHPTVREKSPHANWLLGAIGGAVGYFIRPGVVGGGTGAAIGFGIGMLFYESETDRLERAVLRYDTYLTDYERQHTTLSIAPTASHRTDHAQTLLAARLSTPDMPSLK